jgi:hypothetical protein
LAMATATLKRTVTWTSSPLDACTMKVTANPLPAPSGWHAPANFIPLQRDPEKACPALGAGWVTGFRLARERETFARRSCSNKSSGEHAIATRRIAERAIVRPASGRQHPWKVRSGNPPAHSFRRAEPRDGSESLPPIFEPPWDSVCGVFPNTRNPCRFRFGKSRHKMIDAGKGEAWVIQTRVAARCAVAGGASRAVSTLVCERHSSS